MKKLPDFYPPALAVLPVLILLCLWVYTIASYSALPDPMPIHFDAAGTPDAWAAKSWGAALVLPIIATVVWALLEGTNQVFIRTKDPAKLINIPAKKKDLYTPAELEAIRTFTVRSMLALNIALALLMTYLGIASTRIGLGFQQNLGWPIWLFTGLLLGIAAFMSLRLLRLTMKK